MIESPSSNSNKELQGLKDNHMLMKPIPQFLPCVIVQ